MSIDNYIEKRGYSITTKTGIVIYGDTKEEVDKKFREYIKGQCDIIYRLWWNQCDNIILDKNFNPVYSVSGNNNPGTYFKFNKVEYDDLYMIMDYFSIHLVHYEGDTLIGTWLKLDACEDDSYYSRFIDYESTIKQMKYELEHCVEFENNMEV